MIDSVQQIHPADDNKYISESQPTGARQNEPRPKEAADPDVSQPYSADRFTLTPPLVVSTWIVAPPEPRSVVSRRLISPRTVIGTFELRWPFCVSASKCAE